ncbi:MAG: hypothetical protein L0387_07575 [Acidobacteria bacterium]|nr:hypothetical protein [Acidobacteriota bacterium]MCI0723908.1 hypothetical protein [Acidobacteriota bacterium]
MAAKLAFIPTALTALIIFAAVLNPEGGPAGEPGHFGPRVTVAEGSDPDVAVDSTGYIHVVYERSGNTYYRRVTYPHTVGEEFFVGKGGDPQVAVDSANRPHVVMGAVRYGQWTGNGFGNSIEVMQGWRKPRLVIDSKDRAYITVERMERPRVLLRVIAKGKLAGEAVVVGDDNNGGIDCDSADVIHLTWRADQIYHNTFRFGPGPGKSRGHGASSDFSWCAVDRRDDSVHLVNTVRAGRGIGYLIIGGKYQRPAQAYAKAEVEGVDDPDNVGPTIAVDQLGFKFVSFAGKNRTPYVLVIDPADGMSYLLPLDAEGSAKSGGKFQNPNVGTHPSQPGAYIAWGTGSVSLRSIKADLSRKQPDKRLKGIK